MGRRGDKHVGSTLTLDAQMRGYRIMRRDGLLPSISLTVVGALWGLYWIPVRVLAREGLGPAWLAFIASLVVLLASVPLAAWQPSALRRLSGATLLNGFLVSAAFTLYAVSLNLTSVVNAILLFYLTPVWSVALGAAFYGEPLRAQRATALFLGLAGLVAVLGLGQGLPSVGRSGDWLALVSGVVWAYGTVRSHHGEDPGIVAGVLSFNLGNAASAAAVLLLLPAAAAGAIPGMDVIWGTMPFVTVLSLLMILPSTCVVVWAAHVLPAPRVGILLMTEIVAGAVSAALLSGEPFGPWQAAGSALIIAAGVLEVTAREPAAGTSAEEAAS